MPQAPLRILIVTGEYPPDLGGTATLAARLFEALGKRGHQLRLLTLVGEEGTAVQHEAVRIPRSRPWIIRMVVAILWMVRLRNSYDAAFALSLHTPAVVGGRMARRPVVVFMPGDHAWERSRRLGLTTAGFEEFQKMRGGPFRVQAMRALQRWTVRQAAAVTVPSQFMRTVVRGWLGGHGTIALIPTESVAVAQGRTTSRGRRPPGHLSVVFVGRLVAVKRIDVLLRAVALVDNVELHVVGDGPERMRLQNLARQLGVRTRFSGAQPRDNAVATIAEADALLLASEMENAPIVIAEALAVGTPVVAPQVGGIPEVIVHGTNGLLLPGDPGPDDFARVLRRLRDDIRLREGLQAGQRSGPVKWGHEYSAMVEELLRRVIQAGRPLN